MISFFRPLTMILRPAPAVMANIFGLALPTFALALVMIVGPSRAQDALDRTVVPGVRVGAITADTSYQDLVRLYGAANVKAKQIPIGEGETLDGVSLFAGTSSELLIIWATPGKTIRSIQITRRGSVWRTIYGVGMGSTARQVEAANGRPFTLAGFGWDYSGRTITWRGGRLSKYLTLGFQASQKVSPADERRVLGSGGFRSSNPIMRKKLLFVTFVLVEFAKTAPQ